MDIDLNHTINKLTTASDYMTFPSINGIFTKPDHVLSHKASLSKFWSINIETTFSNHNEINYHGN